MKAYLKEIVIIFHNLSTGFVIEPSLKCIVVCTYLDFIMYLSNAVICMPHFFFFFVCSNTKRILCPSKLALRSTHFKAFCSDVLVTLYMLAGSGLELIPPVAASLKSIKTESN